MGMNAGNLDRRVQFRRAALVNAAPGKGDHWQDHGPLISAARHDVTEEERFRWGALAATLSTRFHVRSTPFTRDLTPEDRLICEGIEFEITGITEVPEAGRRRLLEIAATRKGADDVGAGA